ncbi:MAG: sugar-binding domain-containing protein [Lachnospiraceae bacterium]|nr:sugar-binding domain-containing protein [Lachnospiraceae bacterium]
MKSEVYNQSTCIMSSVIYKYYVENKTGAQISRELGLSTSTVSRLLKRAREEGLVEIRITEPYMTCLLMEQEIQEKFHLKDAMVVPILGEENQVGEDDIKKQVALEGARYVQRNIEDGDTIGLNWGGTMYHLIQYLNPCQKVNANIVTMHGSIASCDRKLAVKTLVRRAAMAFGGKSFSLTHEGLFPSAEELKKVREKKECQEIFDLFEKINMSISGVGDFEPDHGSLLSHTGYLNEREHENLRQKKAASDILLRFVNHKGEECDTDLKDRTLSISIDTYKKIPNKVIVASGSYKARAIRSLVNGGLVDTLIIDYYLAREFINLIH